MLMLDAKSAKYQDWMVMIWMRDHLDDDDLDEGWSLQRGRSKIKMIQNRCHCRCEKYVLAGYTSMKTQRNSQFNELQMLSPV